MFFKTFGDGDDAVVALRQLNEDGEPAIVLVLEPLDGSGNLSEMIMVFDSEAHRDQEFYSFEEEIAFRARDLVREVHSSRGTYKGPV